MKFRFEVDEKTLRELVVNYIKDAAGNLNFNESDIKIETKSKQNYRAEWESAAFRATLEKP